MKMASEAYKGYGLGFLKFICLFSNGNVGCFLQNQQDFRNLRLVEDDENPQDFRKILLKLYEF